MLYDARSGAASSVQTCQAHTDAVLCAVATPDGVRAISSGADRSTKVWDLGLNRVEGVLGKFSNAYARQKTYGTCLAVTADSHRVVVGLTDSTATIFLIQTREELRKITLGGMPRALCLSDDGMLVFAGFDSGMAEAHEIQCCVRLATFVVGGGAVRDLCVTDQSQRTLYAGRSDGRMIPVSMAKDEPVQKLVAGSSEVLSLLVLNNETAVAGHRDGTVRRWSIASGQVEREYKGHADAVTCVASGLDDTFITGSVDNTVRVWDSNTGCEVRRIGGDYVQPPINVAMSPDGTKVAVVQMPFEMQAGSVHFPNVYDFQSG